ncbi:MAG TPA: radical SAM protein [Candidatus Korarchaeota archaeon]|nr:radical SAM protein [Candidatus Korarchaeota archaeon]
MIELPYNSLMVRGKSPSCEICWRGGKLVIFITGMCTRYSDCFYCTISLKKRESDVIYVDESLVKDENDVLRESRLIEAEGAGITGGEPSLVVDRVCRYIGILKENFGKGFDIHLYTNSVGIDQSSLKKLASAGLDEIRFHTWDKEDWQKMRLALDFGFRVGAEMPVIPEKVYEKKLIELVDFLDAVGADFLNLNELEFSDGNRSELISRGYKVRDDSGIAVSSSRETAIRILKYLEEKTGILGYFCSADVKELQVLNRWRRRARNVARSYQQITDQGTLLYGVISGDLAKLLKFKQILKEERCSFEISGGELLVPPEIIVEMKSMIKSMGLKGEIVEIAPIDRYFEISRTPIVKCEL